MRRLMLALLGLLCFCPLACKKSPPANQVVIYASVDAAIAKPILDQFQKQTGITAVLAKESPGVEFRAKSKLTGDVLWDADCWDMLDLVTAGVLAGYDSPAVAAIPKEFKDSAGRWAGTGLRWHVLAVTRTGDGAPIAGTVHHLADLADPALAGRVGIADAADFAAYAALWGDTQSQSFQKALHDRDAKFLAGGAVAQQVGQGALWAGYCDAYEVTRAKAAGGKLDMVLPDQDGAGMLMAPYTVALVAGGQHPQQARLLVDYLLSREVEKRLLDGGYAQSSVFEQRTEPRRMNVNWTKMTK